MLKKYSWILLLLCITNVNGQTQPIFKKIKVILLGTFHFGTTTDKNKQSFNDLFSVKRQQELDTLNNKLAAWKPTQIMVENELSEQAHWDSVFNDYLQKKSSVNQIRNEIFQVAIKTAAKAHLTKVTCVDNSLPLPYDTMAAYEKKHEADSAFPYAFFNSPYPFTDSTKKVGLKNASLVNYYRYINSWYYRQVNMYDYVHFGPAYGKEDDYTGVEFMSVWYERNMKIYTNILRNLKPDDTCIIVLFGSSHIPVLKQLFEYHPLFEVIDIDKVLQ